MKFYADISVKVDKLPHYSYRHIDSFCCRINYIIGARGYGKTYGLKYKVLKDFIEKGKKFAWCRTTEKALENIKSAEQFFSRLKFLSDIGVNEYNIVKNVIYINKKVAGYLFAISTFHNFKGADFEVDTIVWDEFMRAKGERPVNNKREKFFDLVESVGRRTAKHIYCISNSTNQFDDVLKPFNITLNDYGVYLYRERNSLIHYARDSKIHREEMESGLSGYGMTEQEKKMAFSNEFTDFGEYGVAEKMRYLYSLQTNDSEYLAIYYKDSKIFIKEQRGRIPNENNVTFDAFYVNSSTRRLTANEKKGLKFYYDSGNMIFDSGYSRNIVSELLG